MSLEFFDAHRDVRNLFITPEIRNRIMQVQPGETTSCVGCHEQRVMAPPHEGRANEAVLRLLCRSLGLPLGSVRLKGGASSRDKWVELDGIDAAELGRRLKQGKAGAG